MEKSIKNEMNDAFDIIFEKSFEYYRSNNNKKATVIYLGRKERELFKFLDTISDMKIVENVWFENYIEVGE